MKRRTIHLGMAALALAASTVSTLAAASNKEMLGEAVPASAAERTVVINPGTNYVNVTGGDVVKFVVGDKTFTWDFDTAFTVGAFDLNLVAPAGTLDHKVTIYIARDPTYFGGA